mmetsp:Transcript_16504/g.23461  ORF Transcript_16504/g.23461 Transcript_16504/m.23461 type:complete len:1396 (+) Transcript_16504:70-4257(+)
MASFDNTIPSLLSKTEHYDKDERYMATSDLCEVLKRCSPSSRVNDVQPMRSMSRSSSGGYRGRGYQNQMHHNSQFSIDPATEKSICTAVLKLLDDKSNDVQAIAVKTLGVLLVIAHEEQIVVIADRLVSLVLDKSKSELRDVYTIGLCTLAKTVPMEMGNLVSHRLVDCLIDGIRGRTTGNAPPQDQHKTIEEISLSCLDIMNDILVRFGALPFVCRKHEQILQVTLSQLSSESQVVRKRSGNAIGFLSVVLSDQLLYKLVENILAQIDCSEGLGRSGKRRALQEKSERISNYAAVDNLKVADTRALIRTMCTISGSVGHRLGQEQLNRIIPIFLRFCDPEDANAGDDDNYDIDGDNMSDTEEESEETVSHMNDLRESCFIGFESFVKSCPSQVQPHLSPIIHSALAYMRFDPNYSYGDENNGESNDSIDDDGFDDDEDEEEYEDLDDEFSDDDDDESWKVRRSAIRVLAAVVNALKGDLSKIWIVEYAWKKSKTKTTLAGALVERFKEREENCRVDIVDCFNCLLSLTIEAATAGDVKLLSPNAMLTDSDNFESQITIDLRTKFVPAILKASINQLTLKKGGIRTKSSALKLLSTLSISPGGIGGAEQIESVFTNIKSILKDDGETVSGSSNKALILDALSMVKTAITSGQHEISDLMKAISQEILPELCKAVEESWYKITSEALRVLAEIPHLLILSTCDNSQKRAITEKLYASILPRLAEPCLDQEIKECALVASASLLSILHEMLPSEQSEKILQLLVERVKNESTRIPAIKAFIYITSNKPSTSTKVNFMPIFPQTISELSLLLLQKNRTVRQSALECLYEIIRYSYDTLSSIDSNILGDLLRELGSIASDSDQHISQLSFSVSTLIVKNCDSCQESIMEYFLPQALDLSTSPLIHDSSLDSLLSFLKQVIERKVIGFQQLLAELQSRISSIENNGGQRGGSKQAVSNLAKCIATITSCTSHLEREKFVLDLLAILEGKESSQNFLRMQLALRASGDLGQLIDYSTINGVTNRLSDIYMSSFDSASEDVKHAGAYGLGHASVGAMDVFLPIILEGLEEKNQKKHYFLLSSLHELILCHQISNIDISSSVSKILPHLLGECAAEEEGIRNIVAECLGSLVCLQPHDILPKLIALISLHGEKSQEYETKGLIVEKSDLVCWTIASTIKFAIAGRANSDELYTLMPKFLLLLKEKDLNVRNAALLMVFTAVHHNVKLVVNFMHEDILPSLHEVGKLVVKRTIDMGPFKHVVDDALPLRKTALSIYAKCLEKSPSTVDISALIDVLIHAMSDKEDIQLQAHQIVLSLCKSHPSSLSDKIELFVEPLEKTLMKKMGSGTGTDLERAHSLIKSALKVVLSMSCIDEAMKSVKFSDFVNRTMKNEKFRNMLLSAGES